MKDTSAFEARLQDLYRKYLSGELTLRALRVARQLGLGYRELYDLMETRGLAL